MPRGEAPRYIEPAPPYPKKTKCAMRRNKNGSVYKICYKSDTGNPPPKTKSTPKKAEEKKPAPKKPTEKPKSKPAEPKKAEPKKAEPKTDTQGDKELYNFNVEWTERTGTKRYKFFEAIKNKQGNRSSISFSEIKKLAKNILGANEQTDNQIRSYIDNDRTEGGRGFIQRNKVKKVKFKDEDLEEKAETKQPKAEKKEEKEERKDLKEDKAEIKVLKEEKAETKEPKTEKGDKDDLYTVFTKLEDAKKFSAGKNGKIETRFSLLPFDFKVKDKEGRTLPETDNVNKFLQLLEKKEKERKKDGSVKGGYVKDGTLLKVDVKNIENEIFPDGGGKKTRKLIEKLIKEGRSVYKVIWKR